MLEEFEPRALTDADFAALKRIRRGHNAGLLLGLAVVAYALWAVFVRPAAVAGLTFMALVAVAIR